MNNKEMKFNFDIEEMKAKLADEEVDCLLFLGQLKRLENDFKELKEVALENAVNEFDLYGEKTVKLGGYTFSKTQSGRYSYKHSEEWLKLSKNTKDYEDLMKQSYQAAKKDNVIIDSEGVIVTQAYYTSNKPSISVKIKK